MAMVKNMEFVLSLSGSHWSVLKLRKGYDLIYIFKRPLWVQSGDWTTGKSTERGEACRDQDGNSEKWPDWGSISEVQVTGLAAGFWYEAWGEKNKQGLWLCLGLCNLVHDAETEKIKMKAGLHQMLKEKWFH